MPVLPHANHYCPQLSADKLNARLNPNGTMMSKGPRWIGRCLKDDYLGRLKYGHLKDVWKL